VTAVYTDEIPPRMQNSDNLLSERAAENSLDSQTLGPQNTLVLIWNYTDDPFHISRKEPSV